MESNMEATPKERLDGLAINQKTGTGTGIKIELKHFPGAFFLWFCCPRLEVAGDTYEKPWGTHFISLDPGKHELTVYFKYLGIPRCGESHIKFDLEEGEIKRVEFSMPPLLFLPANLTLTG